MEEIGLRPAGDADTVLLDLVVTAQVVLHDVVLHDVEVAVRRDDALADRVVPARNLRDDGEPQAARCGEERHGARGLDVREHERRALPPHRLEQPPRDVPPRAEEPAPHRVLDGGPAWERAVAVGVEHPVGMPRLHALGVEPVPVVQPHGERVVAEPPVEPGVDPSLGSVCEPARSGEVVAVEDGHAFEACHPLGGLGTWDEEHHRDVAVEALTKTAHDPRIDEDANRELVGEHEPGPLRAHLAGTPTCKAIRVARDRPSSPWKRSASAGVPHAGQPSTPKTVTTCPGSAARRPSPSPPTGAWSSSTKTCSNRPTSAASHSASKRLSHGSATTRTDSSPLSPSRSAATSASWSITGPYETRTASPPSRSTVPRPTAATPGRSIRRGEGPIASRTATVSAASIAAQRTSVRVSSGEPGWTIATFGSAASREMSRTLWCDLPGPAGMSPA